MSIAVWGKSWNSRIRFEGRWAARCAPDKPAPANAFFAPRQRTRPRLDWAGPRSCPFVCLLGQGDGSASGQLGHRACITAVARGDVEARSAGEGPTLEQSRGDLAAQGPVLRRVHRDLEGPRRRLAVVPGDLGCASGIVAGLGQIGTSR